MTTKNKAAAKKDAVGLLMEDHKRVKGLFEEFKKFEEAPGGDYDELKQELIDAVCGELKVHAQVEEEIFYPAMREACPDEDALMNEADVEHAGAKDLIAQIESGSSSDPMTCARFTVLGEYIDHHVKEEESEMFPKASAAKLNLVALAKEIVMRKNELKAELGLTPYDETPSFAQNGANQMASLWDRVKSVTGTSARR